MQTTRRLLTHKEVKRKANLEQDKRDHTAIAFQVRSTEKVTFLRTNYCGILFPERVADLQLTAFDLYQELLNLVKLGFKIRRVL
jgi:hypothetical protein